eukprot:scaffold20982_cov58-Phaeocystis_antarctica.AAC.1
MHVLQQQGSASPCNQLATKAEHDCSSSGYCLCTAATTAGERRTTPHSPRAAHSKILNRPQG